MHEKLAKAMQRIMQGKSVMGEKGDGSGEEGKDGNAKKSSNGKKGYGSLSNEQDFIFYDLPPPVMPSKD